VSALRFNAPLSDARAAHLAGAALEAHPRIVLDLGCGRAESYAAQRKAEYEQHYRGGLGFAWLVLDRVPQP
jgi:hypothetical protein